MPGARGMLAKALIAALLGVLTGGAFVLSGSLRESGPPPPPIQLRDLDGGRERNQAPPSRRPQREGGRPTAPAADPSAASAPVPAPAESDSAPAPVAPPSSLPDPAPSPSPAPAPEPVRPVEETGTEDDDDLDDDDDGDDGGDDDDGDDDIDDDDD